MTSKIGTTPMTPSIDVDRWRQAQWSVLRGAVDFWVMHAYTGNNDPERRVTGV